MNPLIANTPIETVQNVAQAMNALMVLMAESNSDLCRLMAPMQSALDHVATTDDQE